MKLSGRAPPGSNCTYDPARIHYRVTIMFVKQCYVRKYIPLKYKYQYTINTVRSNYLRILVPLALLEQRSSLYTIEFDFNLDKLLSQKLCFHLLASGIDGDFAVALKLLDSVVQGCTSQTNTICIHEPITIARNASNVRNTIITR